MKSRMREICTYGSVRGIEDTANSHYDILEQYKVEKRGGCRGSVYSTGLKCFVENAEKSFQMIRSFALIVV